MELKQEGLSILLVEQNAPSALKLSDYVHIMSKGRVVHSSLPQELRERQDLQKAFLGV